MDPIEVDKCQALRGFNHVKRYIMKITKAPDMESTRLNKLPGWLVLDHGEMLQYIFDAISLMEKDDGQSETARLCNTWFGLLNGGLDYDMTEVFEDFPLVYAAEYRKSLKSFNTYMQKRADLVITIPDYGSACDLAGDSSYNESYDRQSDCESCASNCL